MPPSRLAATRCATIRKPSTGSSSRTSRARTSGTRRSKVQAAAIAAAARAARSRPLLGARCGSPSSTAAAPPFGGPADAAPGTAPAPARARASSHSTTRPTASTSTSRHSRVQQDAARPWVGRRRLQPDPQLRHAADRPRQARWNAARRLVERCPRNADQAGQDLRPHAVRLDRDRAGRGFGAAASGAALAIGLAASRSAGRASCRVLQHVQRLLRLRIDRVAGAAGAAWARAAPGTSGSRAQARRSARTSSGRARIMPAATDHKPRSRST